MDSQASRRCDDRNTQLSKLMSKVLRHQAHKWRLNIRRDGFIALQEMILLDQFQGYQNEDVLKVAADCEKQRFEVKEFDGELFIRARQGHSISSVLTDELLERLSEEDVEKMAFCYHGTHSARINSIRNSGLQRMARNHIHLLPARPGSDSVISGLRKTADVLITIDMIAAQAAGIVLYRSGNNVILTEGIGNTGTIPLQFLVEFTPIV